METNKKQTAVKRLLGELQIRRLRIKSEPDGIVRESMINNLLIDMGKYQQMEREQMINFYDSAIGAFIYNCSSISETEQLTKLNGNQYFEELYGK